MVDLINIQEKWQKKWDEQKVFQPEIEMNKEKFFLSFPYPYINAYSHIGHLYTLARVDAFARYKRNKGFNVLFPQGWHATGSPIVNAANRVKDREEKQVKIMKDMGIEGEELKKFEKPEYWLKFFAPEFKKDYTLMGISIDWRREFHTTSLNPYYDKFIRWQFNKLKEKNYVIQGKFPVVWCPKCKNAVGDHSRSEGEGQTTQEFYLFKFKLDDGRFLMTATLRHDTSLGITNVYANPEMDYEEVEVKNERWIVGMPIIEKLRNQDYEVKQVEVISGKDLIGKKVEFLGRKMLVLPATFLKADYGTGMVHSVPSDSADDLIALRDLQKDDKLIEKYGLNKEEVKAIEPIEIFNTPEVGGNSAQFFLDKYKVTSQNQRDKLDKIKKELYKLTFAKSTFNNKYKDFLGHNLEGKTIPKGQEIIKKELLDKGVIEIFYELTGKVVCRCLTPSIVKIVDNQWFINYADPDWKKLTHKCLDNLKLYPEKARQQFDYVIDWLHEWACTREQGLGTHLPWDEQWLIESLSDSTIYMAYYTIAHRIKDIPVEKINDAFFDYVFFNKGKEINVDIQLANEMRDLFNYWFPCDFRNSGKDLIQNHLTFYMFNHTALFPEDKWPKGIAVNGWVTVDGQKMSKSLGNMIPMREMAVKYSADVSRATILSGGEGLDDPNWDSDFAKSLMLKLEQWVDYVKENYGKGRTDRKKIDDWMESRLNEVINSVEKAMDETLFRTAFQQAFFELQRHLKWYLKRCKDNPNKEILERLFESQIVLMQPFTPHICEEAWEIIGKIPFVANTSFPEIKGNLDVDHEGLVRNLITDINSVTKLAKLDKVSSIKLFVSDNWKYDLFDILKDKLAETRDFKEVISTVMASPHKQHGKEITKMLPKYIKGGMPEYSSKENEIALLEEAKEFLEEEFKANLEIVFVETDEPKAKQALPGKPAILVS